MGSSVSISSYRKTTSTVLTRQANATAYAAGQVVSDAGLVQLLFPIARAGGLSGIIRELLVVDGSVPATKLDGELWLFDTQRANEADAAAFAPSVAQLLTLVGVIAIPVAAWKVAGANGVINHVTGLAIPFNQATSGETQLFGTLVARNAYTPANAGKIQFRMKADLD